MLRDDGTAWVNLGDSYAASRSYQVSDNKNPCAVATGQESRSRPPEGLKQKDMCGIPWRVAFALQADGWYLRQDIIWAKPNPMPESVRDRCTKSHEYIFLLSKSERYYFDAEAISEPVTGSTIERLSQPNLPNQKGSDRVPGKTNGTMKAVAPSWNGSTFTKGKTAVHQGKRAQTEESRSLGAKGEATDAVENRSGAGARMGRGAGWRDDPANNPATRNKRSVWTVATAPFKEAHFATFPPDLIQPCILAGCPERCCPTCGTPWAIDVERIDSGFDGSKYGERVVAAGGGVIGGGTAKSTLGSGNGKLTGKRVVNGYRQACACAEHQPVAGTVLDPFGGAGTTGLVADRHKRDAVLIELNPEYAEMAKRRIVGDSPMFAEVTA